MKVGTDIDKFLRPLCEKDHQVYLTNELQLVDVLEWILGQVGRAEVWQTSFSVSNEFLSRLFFIQKKGLISNFNLLLDFKATNKTLLLWPFICQTIKDV
ncbi:MAG: hypothetical protein K6F89_05245, partial [Prevotella sp.]|nr:hypothetical protein [Prevotella sp.]